VHARWASESTGPSVHGSHGYEALDAQFLVDAGADYVKEDSCGGDQNHSVAFSDYAKMRDALNKSGTAAGRPIFFSLCGWKDWYAPPDSTLGYGGGKTLGNSYRIAGDGSGWAALGNCANTIARIGKYSQPGAWADPDLLIGPETKRPMHIGGQTDEQARTQFSLWSVFPAPLLISQNVLTWSKYALETYSNTDVIAVNQDPVVHGAGTRLVGSDLAFPCKPGSASCSNVWGRVLSDKAFVLVFVNNANASAIVACDSTCLGVLAQVSGVPVNEGRYTPRDLWSPASPASRHLMEVDDAGQTRSVGAVVPGNGGSRMLRLTPAAQWVV